MEIDMKIRTIALVGALLLLLPSCEGIVPHDRAGEPVTFGASSDYKGIQTKTEYSGVVSGGKERIDWVDGDQVRIFMYTHDANNRWGNYALSYKDYSVVNIHSQGEKSVGQLSALTDKLEWTEGRVHDFYSVYPPTFPGYNSQMEQDWFWGNVAPISFTLPSSQNGRSSGSNMDHLYMAAVSEGNTSDGRGSVVLQYYPLVTTLHFTFQNNFTSRESISVSQIKLSSTDNVQLTGTFQASVSGGRFVPSADNVYDGSTSISLGVSETVRYGETVDFVFFLVPRSSYNPANLKLTVTTEKGASSISLANSTVSAFLSCQKYNLTLNIDENGEPAIDVSDIAQILIALSDTPYMSEFEYLAWMNPPGLYRKNSGYPPVHVTDDELKAMVETVTTISTDVTTDFNYLLKTLSPRDFSVFPHLKSVHLSSLGNTESIDVENLNNLLDLAFSGNQQEVTISHCSFSAGSQPLVLNATRTMNVDINNVSGLTEVHLIAGDNGGGNIGNVTIHDCPDLKVIKVYRSSGNAQVAMETAQFNRLPALETIYLDQVNATNSITISNCDELVRVIVANQTNWLLKSITLANLPLLGDSAADSSEYGLTGFNVDKVSMSINATKVNCPNLGPSFVAYQPYYATPVTIDFH